MFVEVVTTITTKVNIDTMRVEGHDVDVSVEEGVPPQLAYAAAGGGCRAALLACAESLPERLRDNLLSPLTD